ILASMFMFRLMIYLYDLKHNLVPRKNLTQTLSYFFLLPNVVFPLFPVVDYSTYCQTYYDSDRYRIYQRGIYWMFRGVVLLILYRYINYYWVIGPEKVHSTSTLVQYMISNYLLILRLTGQFHLVVGILHLFGFNLPRIMDVFLLSTGFTDYWRRVNVYWKDFIQKVFYYPTYFRMRKAGSTTRLVVATILGFGVTWFFHAYQWFWIRGAFLFSLPDMLFWLSMGLLVLANSIYEAKYGRKRALVKGVASLSEIASKALRATGVFVVMSLLWSLWISPSVSDWTDLLASAEVTFPEVGLALLLVTAAIGSAMLVYEKSLKSSAANPLGDAPAFFRFAAPPAAVILLLYFGVQPTYAFRLGTSVSDLIADLKTDRLNERDAALLERGYYENLTHVSTFNSQLSELYMQKPDDWLPLEETNAVRKTEDFRKYELVPFLNGTVKHAPFITNRWGMRDDDYEQMPPAKTCRIAMIGASVAQGSGVLHEESFEYLVEKRLNQERRGGKYAKYEILNFAVGGYNILQQLAALEKKVFDFKPDMLFCVSHTRDEDRLFKFLLETPFQAIPYEGIQQIMSKAGITAGMKTNRAAKLLEPYNAEIMLWAYQRIVAECRARDVVPVWICLPSEPGLKDSKRAASLSAVAAEAGFVVLNLIDAYDSAKGAYLQVTPWDKHPNAKGHRLLANRIYAALLEHQDKIPLGFSAAANLSASKAE
ncbi:hypothetical protein HUU05_23470, partial [candidate division KSB1 bacterium]|nr:hypothetical protein [candidate division KSB1 bacterium]